MTINLLQTTYLSAIYLEKFCSDFPTYLKVLTSSNPLFLCLWFLIVLSLCLNSISNLVYRVLNLSLLSILTVATWSFLSDLLFIYIVYIIAFVGAVMMLFLSVVLMLPTSVVSPSAKMVFVCQVSSNEIFSLATTKDLIIFVTSSVFIFF